MVIYINDQDYTVRFRDDASFSENDGQIFLSRDNGTLSVSTPDTIGLIIKLENGLLEFSVEIDEKFRNMTRGLLGNFNADSGDDFIFPNGTVLSNSSTERELYVYGLTWAIPQEESLFSYDVGQNTSSFTNANFTPLFLDETSQELRTEAESVCGSTTNLPCIFDYIATRNSELALATAGAIDAFTAQEAIAANSPPVISGATQINATVGQVSTISLTATDVDNDNITYIIINSPSSGTFITTDNGNTFQAEYTPISTDPVSIGLVAQDSGSLQSEVAQIPVVTCSGCNNQGTCDYVDVRSTSSPYFSVAYCVCDAPYSGTDCENDKDACESSPCPQGTTCTDIPAAEEQATGMAYNCSNCPDGFMLNLNRTKCEDIDECGTSSPCDVNAVCTNTLGGYFCTCNDGYRKSGANTCLDIDECVENQNQCEQLCENTAGSYGCGCEQGFDLDFLGFNCSRSLVAQQKVPWFSHMLSHSHISARRSTKSHPIGAELSHGSVAVPGRGAPVHCEHTSYFLGRLNQPMETRRAPLPRRVPFEARPTLGHGLRGTYRIRKTVPASVWSGRKTG
ncbi:fibrillin-1 [Plakobranchus ocellatus]|uniref:Fibrillin-1 n=1 Tax=Plakobranchus ocellatus TaxID=259542 RepID=A0AAV4BLI0_9GAST|nr:fibrillin-1 [Plakobranchus ocellatus]